MKSGYKESISIDREFAWGDDECLISFTVLFVCLQQSLQGTFTSYTVVVVFVLFYVWRPVPGPENSPPLSSRSRLSKALSSSTIQTFP